MLWQLKKYKIMSVAVSLMMVFFLTLARCSQEDEGYQWLLSQSQGSSSAGTGVISDDFSLTVSDVRGGTEFIFETVASIDVYTVVLDADSPVAGSLVQIREVSGTKTGRVIFQAVSDENGLVKGSFSIDTSTSLVQLSFIYGEKEYNFTVDVTQLTKINRTLYIYSNLNPVVIVDSDKDGVQDKDDAYPNDPSRSAKVRYPAEKSYTIAFEDLFPKKGDADFNDYVLSTSYELDLNAKGEVVELRGSYTHIAKGAGYNHTLHMRLPNTAGANFSSKEFDENGALLRETSKVLADSEDLNLLGRSDATIKKSNTAKNSTFQAGNKLDFTLQFANSVKLSDLGSLPFDLFIKVLNTKQEIHFAGRYKKADGNDMYLDSDGFPWAIMVPNNWKWMYEKANIHDAYLNFIGWYTSAGQNNADWYNFPVDSKVFPYLP